MRKLIFTLTVLIISGTSYAQNSPPQVTNVQAQQRAGTKLVDITYDLADTDGDSITITAQISADSGQTFSITPVTFVENSAVSSGIQPGSGKKIVWDAGVDYPNQSGTNFQIKVTADDGYIPPDGNSSTVTIGDQEWMVKNLKVTSYRNGDPIPNVTDNSEWGSLSTGAYSASQNDETLAATYGYFYNWHAVNDSRGLAPAGWHVPSDDEWKELEMTLGMSQSEANNSGYRGTDEGNKLKQAGSTQEGTGLWYSPNNDHTNESGFTALPGASRDSGMGKFKYVSYDTYFWTSTHYQPLNKVWYRHLFWNSSRVERSINLKEYGYSVRCVRDAGGLGNSSATGFGLSNIFTLNTTDEPEYDLTITEDVLVQNVPTDQIRLEFYIKNNGSQAAPNVKFRAYIDSPDFPMITSPSSGMLSTIAADDSVKCFVRLEGVASAKAHGIVFAEIYEIDGSEASFVKQTDYSWHYIVNRNQGKNNRPYNVSLDGYSFPNAGLSITSMTDWWSSNLDKYFGLLPFINFVRTWDGRCYGYAGTSNRYFEFEDEKPVSSETYDMASNNIDVSANITRYFNSQILLKFRSGPKFNDSMSSVVDIVRDYFSNNKPLIVLLDGHAISAYKLVENHTQQEAYMYVYENNEPGGLFYIKFDLAKNTFYYEEYTKINVMYAEKDRDWLELADDFDTFLEEQKKSLWERGKAFLGIGSPVRTWLVDDQNRTIGYPNTLTESVNEIPDAEIERFETAGGDSATVFHLPKDLQYTTYIAAVDTGTLHFETIVPKSETTASELHNYNIPVTTSEWNARIILGQEAVLQLEIDEDGDGTYEQIVTGIENTDGNDVSTSNVSGVPTGFKVYQNYPNPFNPETSIRFEIPKDSYVTLSIYDILGNKVKTLVSTNKTAGIFNAVWNARNDQGLPVSSGAYFYRIQAGEYSSIKKMVLLR